MIHCWLRRCPKIAALFLVLHWLLQELRQIVPMRDEIGSWANLNVHDVTGITLSAAYVKAARERKAKSFRRV